MTSNVGIGLHTHAQTHLSLSHTHSGRGEGGKREEEGGIREEQRLEAMNRIFTAEEQLNDGPNVGRNNNNKKPKPKSKLSESCHGPPSQCFPHYNQTTVDEPPAGAQKTSGQGTKESKPISPTHLLRGSGNDSHLAQCHLTPCGVHWALPLVWPSCPSPKSSYTRSTTRTGLQGMFVGISAFHRNGPSASSTWCGVQPKLTEAGIEGSAHAGEASGLRKLVRTGAHTFAGLV